MKINASFYKHTLLPSLFHAKSKDIDIRNKAKLLAHFNTLDDTESENYWICCATAEDLEETAQIVDLMQSGDSDVLAQVGIAEKDVQDMDGFVPAAIVEKTIASLHADGDNKLARKLRTSLEVRAADEVDKLNKMLWKSSLRVTSPEHAKDNDVKRLAKEAKAYLQENTQSDEKDIVNAIIDFIDQVYISDPDFEGSIKHSKIFAADLYYKNRGDELDELTVSSDMSEKELELAKRELLKHL